jgi:hypothetical protein
VAGESERGAGGDGSGEEWVRHALSESCKPVSSGADIDGVGGGRGSDISMPGVDALWLVAFYRVTRDEKVNSAVLGTAILFSIETDQKKIVARDSTQLVDGRAFFSFSSCCILSTAAIQAV